MQDRFLVISDLQIPFEAPRALEFCVEVQKHFKIPKENILNVGDEVDEYFGSLYKKSADATHSPNSEIKESKDKLKRWFNAFPLMRLCESNHGERWAKRAAEAEIPSQMMRKYQEVLETPAGWQWARKWIIKTKRPFLMMHGMGYSGAYSFRQMAINNGISTVHGHLHSSAGIAYIKTEGLDIWGMNTGCLIDVEAYAFHYGKDNKLKPNLSISVVLDDGAFPLLIPYK